MREGRGRVRFGRSQNHYKKRLKSFHQPKPQPTFENSRKKSNIADRPDRFGQKGTLLGPDDGRAILGRALFAHGPTPAKTLTEAGYVAKGRRRHHPECYLTKAGAEYNRRNEAQGVAWQ